eukprot:1193420-Prorocentrum_minimum.AAC.5
MGGGARRVPPHDPIRVRGLGLLDLRGGERRHPAAAHQGAAVSVPHPRGLHAPEPARAPGVLAR